MNRICYGQMLAASLDTLKHLKTNLIDLFDKEKMFEDYWDEAPGLQDCREFEEFVENYQRDIVLRSFSSPCLQVSAISQAISSALLASALSTKSTCDHVEYSDHDMKMLRSHVSALSSSGLFGHAMTLQTALVTRAVTYHIGNIDDEWKALMMLKNGFQDVVLQILRDPFLPEGYQTKVPGILMDNPLPIPEELVLAISMSEDLDKFRDANWEIDCLGRTLEQIALDPDPFTDHLFFEPNGKRDIIGRSDVHGICANDARLRRIGRHYVDKIEQTNCMSQQPLHYAAVLGKFLNFKYLLSFSDIDADCPDALGRAPVFYAASNGHTKILRLLLDQHGVDIDRLDDNGYTALCMAVRNGHFKAAEYLLEKGANANYVNPNRVCRTAFAQAVYNQDIDIMQLLGAQKCVNVNISFHGETLLTKAVRDDFQEGVQYLLNHENIEVNKRDKFGGTTLSIQQKQALWKWSDSWFNTPKST
jgi:ankyrin repeat protein